MSSIDVSPAMLKNSHRRVQIHLQEPYWVVLHLICESAFLYLLASILMGPVFRAAVAADTADFPAIGVVEDARTRIDPC